MASFSAMSSVSWNSRIFSPPCFLNPLSKFPSRKYRKAEHHNFPRVACIGKQNNTSKGEVPDRRKLVVGIGALFGAAFILDNNNPFAFATPMFPLMLDSAVSTVVKRPKKSRSKKEKEEKEEVLVIEGIEFEGNTHVRFDVIINAQQYYKLVRPNNTEFAGSFVNSPRFRNNKIITSMSLGITDLLQDLGDDDDDTVVVTLVPRLGRIKISGIKIELRSD